MLALAGNLLALMHAAGTASAPNGNALAGRATVAALTVVLIVLGIFPAPLLTAIQSTAEGLMP